MRADEFPVEMWRLVFERMATTVPCDFERAQSSISARAVVERVTYASSIRHLRAVVRTCKRFRQSAFDLLWSNAFVRVSKLDKWRSVMSLNRVSPHFDAIKSLGSLSIKIEDGNDITFEHCLKLLQRCDSLHSLHLTINSPGFWNPYLLDNLATDETLASVKRFTVSFDQDEIPISWFVDLIKVMPRVRSIEMDFEGETIIDQDFAPLNLVDLRTLVIHGLFVEECDYDLPILFNGETIERIETFETDHACRFKETGELGAHNLKNLTQVFIKGSDRFTSCAVKVAHFKELPNVRVLDLEKTASATESLIDIVRDVPASVESLSTGVFVKSLVDVDLVAVVKALKRKALNKMLLIGAFRSSADYFVLRDDRTVSKLVKRLKAHTGVFCTIRVPSIAFADASRAAERAYPNADFESMEPDEQQLLLSSLSTVDFDFSPKSKRKRANKKGGDAKGANASRETSPIKENKETSHGKGKGKGKQKAK